MRARRRRSNWPTSFAATARRYEGERRTSRARRAAGDHGDHGLPHGGARRPCRALRRLRLTRIAYNSCRNRHCPKCQGAARAEWLAARQAELLPVPYFHVVFTLPPRGADRLPEQADVYGLLMRAAAQALMALAAERARRQDRPDRRLAHLGADADPSSACPLSRARRRPVARRRALDRLQAGLLPVRPRAVETVPPALPRRPRSPPAGGSASSANSPGSPIRRFAPRCARCAARSSSTPSRRSADRACSPISPATRIAPPSPIPGWSPSTTRSRVPLQGLPQRPRPAPSCARPA